MSECYPDWNYPKHGKSPIEQERDALKAEAQALRDQVKALQSGANSYQSGYDEGRRMGTKHRQSEVEQLTREVAELREKNDKEWRRAGIAEENLRAVLSARVVVLPSVDSVMNIVMRYQWNEKTNVTGTTNWAANLGMKVVDEVKRLNGKVVSEGLLREAKRHLGNWLELHECECEGGFHYCGREQVAKTHRELRALLDEEIKNEN